MNENLMIKIENVSKQYRLGAIGGGTLQGDIQSWWALKRGKEDPNSKIGTKIYTQNEKFMALSNISFEVKKGERVGIIGHNGAGKSTLLKLLSRVTAPTDGEIGLNGRVTSMLEVGTGFHGELTGRENIYMNGAILGMTKSEIDSKMEKIIEFSECRKFIDTPVKRYSSGMFVKLAFSVAAHLDSEIMIMDEVLAVGDVAFQKKCLEKMNQVSNDEGRTILYVSHNMNTIAALCNRCIVLDKGKITYDGNVEGGIAQYYNRNEQSYGPHINLTNKRHYQAASREIDLNAIHLKDRIEAYYHEGESVRVIVDYTVKEIIKDAMFRLTLFSRNNVSVGTSFSQALNFGEKGDFSAELILDTKTLSVGEYFVSIAINTIDSSGENNSIDHVTSAFKFEITRESGLKTINWHSSSWGYVKLPNLDVNVL